MPYRLFIPEDYDKSKNYPIVLFLHGAGTRGFDNERQLISEGARVWAKDENQAQNPCFILAPQCPSGSKWVNVNWSLGTYSTEEIPISKPLSMVLNILEKLQKRYSLDTNNYFVTGLSMGGYGTWDLIIRNPSLFKAAIPICGAGDTSKADVLANMPIWSFHSKDDDIVPVCGSREMVNAINALGKNNRDTLYTEFDGLGHASWKPAYQDENLVSWLFNTKPVKCERKPVNKEENVVAFPNPIRKGQTLCLNNTYKKKTKVSILNLNGEVVYEHTFENTDLIRINDLDMDSGFYLLRINDELDMKKIIIL